MTTTHLEFLVEEPSMEAFLRALLPRLLPQNRSFEIHAFQGKADLLDKLESRLRGYSSWMPSDWRIVVVVDRDDDDCVELKNRLEDIARRVGLITRSTAGRPSWQLLNRIAIEELEAWYFGDWKSVCSIYTKLPKYLMRRRQYRDSDAIQGGTWEAFERALQQCGYYKGGLPKIEVARAIGEVLEATRSLSKSFAEFRDGILEAIG